MVGARARPLDDRPLRAGELLQVLPRLRVGDRRGGAQGALLFPQRDLAEQGVVAQRTHGQTARAQREALSARHHELPAGRQHELAGERPARPCAALEERALVPQELGAECLREHAARRRPDHAGIEQVEALERARPDRTDRERPPRSRLVAPGIRAFLRAQEPGGEGVDPRELLRDGRADRDGREGRPHSSERVERRASPAQPEDAPVRARTSDAASQARERAHRHRRGALAREAAPRISVPVTARDQRAQTQDGEHAGQQIAGTDGHPCELVELFVEQLLDPIELERLLPAMPRGGAITEETRAAPAMPDEEVAADPEEEPCGRAERRPEAVEPALLQPAGEPLERLEPDRCSLGRCALWRELECQQCRDCLAAEVGRRVGHRGTCPGLQERFGGLVRHTPAQSGRQRARRVELARETGASPAAQGLDRRIPGRPGRGRRDQAVQEPRALAGGADRLGAVRSLSEEDLGEVQGDEASG